MFVKQWPRSRSFCTEVATNVFLHLVVKSLTSLSSLRKVYGSLSMHSTVKGWPPERIPQQLLMVVSLLFLARMVVSQAVGEKNLPQDVVVAIVQRGVVFM